jgi:hypothetical protein
LHRPYTRRPDRPTSEVLERLLVSRRLRAREPTAHESRLSNLVMTRVAGASHTYSTERSVNHSDHPGTTQSANDGTFSREPPQYVASICVWPSRGSSAAASC